MKKRIWVMIFALNIVASSCQKDEMVMEEKSPGEAISIVPNTPLFSTITSLGRDANAMSAYSNGGYIIAGGGAGPNLAILLKIDEKGEVVWHKEFCEGFFRSIVHTSDNNYIVAGTQLSEQIIMKVDSRGSIIWSKKIDGATAGASSMIETSDGDYVAVGTIRASISDRTIQGWVIKLSKDGEIRWQKTYRHISYSAFNSVVEAADGSYIAAGVTSLNLWMVNLSKNGDLVWEREYGGSLTDVAECVIPAIDGGYLLAGNTSSQDGDVTSSAGSQDLWLVKTDNEGKKLWQKTLGGSGTDYAYSIVANGNSGYVLAGSSSSTDGQFANICGASGDPNGLIVKLDVDGNMSWAQMYEPYRFFFLVKAPNDIFITGSRTLTKEGISAINILGIAIP